MHLWNNQGGETNKQTMHRLIGELMIRGLFRVVRCCGRGGNSVEVCCETF